MEEEHGQKSERHDIRDNAARREQHREKRMKKDLQCTRLLCNEHVTDTKMIHYLVALMISRLLKCHSAAKTLFGTDWTRKRHDSQDFGEPLPSDVSVVDFTL